MGSTAIANKTNGLTKFTRLYFVAGLVAIILVGVLLSPAVAGTMLAYWAIVGLGLAITAFGYSLGADRKIAAVVSGLGIAWLILAVIAVVSAGVMTWKGRGAVLEITNTEDLAGIVEGCEHISGESPADSQRYLACMNNAASRIDGAPAPIYASLPSADELRRLDRAWQEVHAEMGDRQLDEVTWQIGTSVSQFGLTYTYVLHGTVPVDPPAEPVDIVAFVRQLSGSEFREIMYPDFEEVVCSPEGVQFLLGLQQFLPIHSVYQTRSGEVLHTMTMPAGACDSTTSSSLQADAA